MDANTFVCSKHFTEECFEYGLATVEKYKMPRLRRDEFGVCVCPTLHEAHQVKKGKFIYAYLFVICIHRLKVK